MRVFDKTNIKIAFTFIGTLIGAGFASGREIALYFGKSSLASPIIAALASAALAYVFLELGRKSNGDIMPFLFPKTFKIWNLFIAIESFIIFAAMISGSELSIHDGFGFAGAGILSGLLCVGVLAGGMERIKLINTLAVPLIIGLMVVLFVLSPDINMGGNFNVVSPIVYAAMNILSGGIIISKMSGKLEKRDGKAIALIIAIILVALISIVYFIVKSTAECDMPVLQAAISHGIGKAGSILIYISIFTTMVSSLAIASNNKIKTALVLLAMGYIVACLGFSTIVNYTYPVIGVFGTVFAFFAIYKFIVSKKAQPLVLS